MGPTTTEVLKPGQCGACGQIGTHDPECPAGKVTIVDKREEKRLAAEAKRLAEEARALKEKELPADAQSEATEPPPVPEEGDLTARQQRIIELKIKARGSTDGLSLSEEEAAELLRLQAAEDEQQGGEDQYVEAVTAFLVVIDHNGNAQATSNVNLMMRLQREATVDDMDSGCHIVARDIQASMTAKQVIFGMQVSAQAMQQQAAGRAAMQRLQGVPGAGRRR